MSPRADLSEFNYVNKKAAKKIENHVKSVLRYMRSKGQQPSNFLDDIPHTGSRTDFALLENIICNKRVNTVNNAVFLV